jgi:hypothetical protein
VRRPAGVLALALVTGCTGATSSPVAPAAAPTGTAPTGAAPTGVAPTGTAPMGAGAGVVALPAPAGFRVSVEHSETPLSGGLVSWESRWVLTWEPVAGAEEYPVYFATSEGGGSRSRRATDEPRLALQAAAGTSPRERLEQDRAAGLLFTSSQLLVALSARSGEQEGARSPWFPVGDVPVGGIPLPARIEAGPH